MLSKDYILGFVEGGGCFSIAIGKNIDRRERKVGRKNNIKNPYLFTVRPSFRITNSASNRKVLEEIKETLGFGQIYTQERNNNRSQTVAYFYTKSVAECQKAKEFFSGLEFRTTKGKDFALWCQGLELIQQGKHLKKEGLLEVCRLRDQMNFRPTKNKWSTEEIKRILDEKPNHFVAHEAPEQAPLIHNSETHFSPWLEKNQGNSKPNKFVAVSK